MPSDGARVVTRSQRTTIVVYGARTGEIIHVHSALALKGATLPSDADLEADALRHARRGAKERDSAFATLRVSHDEMKHGIRYAVDVEKRRLMAKE
jgi:hypothetical protein